MWALCGDAITRSALKSPSSRSPAVRPARSARSAVRMARPYGPPRHRGSVVALALDRPDLDGGVRDDEHLRRLEGCRFVVDREHVEAGQLLGGLGERPVGDQGGAVRAAADRVCPLPRGELGPTGHPSTALLEQATELVVGLVDGLLLFFALAVPLVLAVGGKQAEVSG